MKILHVIPAVAERYGGPSKAIVEMCRSLQDLGITPTIASTDADGRDRLTVQLGAPTYFENVPAVFFARQFSEGLKVSFPLAKWLRSNVNHFGVVHIHAVFSHSSLAAAAACRSRSVPYLVRPLGSLDPWSLKRKRLRKRLLWQLGVKKMLACAVAIHYTTGEERRLVEESLSTSRGVVVPLGVGEEFFADNSPSAGSHPEVTNEYYVVSLCRIHPKKGLELLIDAFLEVESKLGLGHWRLVLAGDGEPSYLDGLRQEIQRRGAQDRVVFRGWVQGEERVSLVRNASLLALTSHQENFGLSVAESLASGVPVLVSEGVNLANDIRKYRAGWVTPLEGSAIRQTLREALESLDERASRGRAGRELALEHFRWPKVAQKLEKLYKEIYRSR